ncbi:MAG: hypothetical protein COX16_00870 [Deltaproteobacteria bacterium CG23_combo_of_CG06-09_8_20_14_all_51_20]|nr:sensor histidine kinase [bacterium]PIP48540.1 MAG: hypothetical protein COX16_00870 [Deltaproteobacteria bacterium CG23_combo_of_CG06-09_8_20_14_all_51_20]PIW02023.1 MAG: hypothetical protein COW41_01025 [Deltaproteobacteria bacterium CG17_big_fil_post_rev_8_21_14_2_50_51_6]PIY21655.1 MAG: hypothetical protein COZ11_15650 [Deltaproteobacteria bacterium CG_4_10_14_3_um_filter_51_14]PJB37692.1 MAG: hypothetical protein CO107_04035 [Deltaproteobacteria bacterium CG_4_9_14_3_um_filter_51_14]
MYGWTLLKKIVTGLIKNAVENTPGGGKVEIIVRDRSGGVELVVSDTGIGIIEEDQKLIFEGFYPTQDTNAYCSKRPYDFNAGGKGADLLRMVIFSERYKFKMGITSSRCRFILSATDICPGSIDNCPNCSNIEECYESGGTTFTVFFSNCGEKNLVA